MNELQSLPPKKARWAANKTQEEAARDAGIALDTLRRIEQRTERGEAIRVARRTWERLCNVYAVSGLAGVEVRA